MKKTNEKHPIALYSVKSPAQVAGRVIDKGKSPELMIEKGETL